MSEPGSDVSGIVCATCERTFPPESMTEWPWPKRRPVYAATCPECMDALIGLTGRPPDPSPFPRLSLFGRKRKRGRK